MPGLTSVCSKVSPGSLIQEKAQVQQMPITGSIAERAESETRPVLAAGGAVLLEALDLAPAYIGVLTGPDHRWTYVNRALVQASGRADAAELLGRTVRESLPEVEGQGYFELLDQVCRTGAPVSFQESKVVIGITPKLLYVNFVFQPISGPSGATEAVLVHGVDVTQQVLARRSVELNEECFRMAQAAAQMGVFEWDPSDDTRSLSAELHNIFGTRPEDIATAEEWMQRVCPEDRARVTEAMQEAIESGKLEVDYRFQHPERGVRWLYARGSRLPDESRFFGVVLDITERRRAEELLLQREEDFAELANSMPQLVWMSRPDGSVFWTNRRWYEYSGLDPEQASLHSLNSIFDPEALPEVLERWRESAASGSPFEMTFRLRGADGVYRPFLSRAVPLRDATGTITRWFGTNTEIDAEVGIRTELQRNREELRTALIASQRLAAIVESSDDAIVGKDLNGIITSWNPQAERIFGYTAEEMIGQPILRIIPPELHQDETRILTTIARGDRIDHFETERVTKDGRRIEVSLTISPVRDVDGKIVGVAKIARDITMRNQAERALRTSERLASVGRLAATVAHEINNPLEAVTNLVYLAKLTSTQDDVRGFLTEAEEELGRVSVLTRQTLGFYRETRGAGRVRVWPLVETLLSVFASRIRNKGVEVRAEIRQDPEIVAIAGEIRQLAANLVSNSLDAVERGGRIWIRVSAACSRKGVQRSGVRLTVADTGSGIPPEVRSKLFEPFFTTKKDFGTGLGLWISRSIVGKHAGDIRVKSSAKPGASWTVFSIFLPAGPPPGAENTAELMAR